MPILPTLLHHTPRALCGSVEINTDSLVKGMILFDQGGEGGEGEKGHGRKALPSIAAMVAGGNDGLPWQRAGRQ